MYKFLDENLVKEANAIVEEIGVDIETVFRMTLKKIVREKNIAFLLPEKAFSPKVPAPLSDSSSPMPKMTKSRAIALFKKSGVQFTENITFSSKNKSTYIYWSNPGISILSEDWHLILNDWVESKLHLFFIRKGTLSPKDVKARGDNANLIDLQIAPNDPTFTDNRSKISFSDFFVKTIPY